MALSANSDAVTYAKAANTRTAAETGDRIEWVKLSLAFLPLATPVSDAKVLTGRQKPLTEVAIIIAEIRSRDGFEGVGFSYSKRAGGQGIYAHAKEIADNLLGEDPNDIDKIYTKLLWAGASVGRSGMAVQAISPIDIALWDMKAKRAGLPLAKLLGAHRDSVQCYNTSGGFLHTPLDQVLKNVVISRENGIGGIKLKVGQPNCAEDIRRLTAVREALGDEFPLMVDANQQWDRETAIRMGRKMEQFNLIWIEESTRCLRHRRPRPACCRAGYAYRHRGNADQFPGTRAVDSGQCQRFRSARCAACRRYLSVPEDYGSGGETRA